MLSDGRLTLRPFRESDADDVHAAVIESMSDLKPWTSGLTDDFSIRDTRNWLKSAEKQWKDGIAFKFAVTDDTDDSYLGYCGLTHIDEVGHRANLGYWVRSSRGGQDIATTAALLLIRWGLDELKLVRIEITVNAANTGSLRVAEKLGAQREGILRNRFFGNIHSPDGVLFSFIPGDLA